MSKNYDAIGLYCDGSGFALTTPGLWSNVKLSRRTGAGIGTPH